MRLAFTLWFIILISAPSIAAERPRESLRGTLTSLDAPAKPEGEGTLLVIEARTGLTSNAEEASGGKGSPTLELSTDFAAARRLGRFDLSLGLRGSQLEPLGAEDARFADIAAEISLSTRLDAGITVGAGADFLLEDDKGTRFTDFGVSAQAERTEGALRPSLTLTANRVDYAPELLLPGIVLPNDGRDHRRYGMEAGTTWTLRKGLEATFAGGGLVYAYRTGTDDFGFARSSRAAFLRGSLAFTGARLTASIDARLLRRTYDEVSFRPSTVLILDASLAYGLNERTKLAFELESDLEETNVPGATGIFTQYAELGLVRAIDERVSIRFAGYLDREVFRETEREDRTYGLLVALQRRVGEHAAIDIRGEYERFDSPFLGERFDTFRLSTGLRVALQRT